MLRHFLGGCFGGREPQHLSGPRGDDSCNQSRHSRRSDKASITSLTSRPAHLGRLLGTEANSPAPPGFDSISLASIEVMGPFSIVSGCKEESDCIIVIGRGPAGCSCSDVPPGRPSPLRFFPTPPTQASSSAEPSPNPREQQPAHAQAAHMPSPAEGARPSKEHDRARQRHKSSSGAGPHDMEWAAWTEDACEWQDQWEAGSEFSLTSNTSSARLMIENEPTLGL